MSKRVFFLKGIKCQPESGEAYAKSPDEVDEVLWMTTSEILVHERLPRYLMENIKLAEKMVNQVQ